MRELAEAFTIISEIINDSSNHSLTDVQINALRNAQKAITLVELIGLTANDKSIKE